MTEDGITVGREIGRRLRADGVDISDQAVNRYLAKVGRVATSRAEKIIQEHVDRVMPDDLKALEELEAYCLNWSRENPVELADRLADVKAAIDFELDQWASDLKAAEAEKNPVKRGKLIRGIIKRCVDYVLQDDRLQDKRIRAMAQAVKIIELKLSKAGMLNDEGKGRIVILDRSEEYEPHDPKAPAESKRKAFVIKFGGKNDPLGHWRTGWPGLPRRVYLSACNLHDI